MFSQSYFFVCKCFEFGRTVSKIFLCGKELKAIHATEKAEIICHEQFLPFHAIFQMSCNAQIPEKKVLFGKGFISLSPFISMYLAPLLSVCSSVCLVNKGHKCCGKSRNYSSRAISPFSCSVWNEDTSRKNNGLLGKGLIFLFSIYIHVSCSFAVCLFICLSVLKSKRPTVKTAHSQNVPLLVKTPPCFVKTFHDSKKNGQNVPFWIISFVSTSDKNCKWLINLIIFFLYEL